jgi:malonyl-CoA O-methyltransferase
MFQWVNDLPRAVAECHRVLRPGGLFAFALFGAGTLRELRAAHAAALAETGSTRPSHMQQFPTFDEVRSALSEAGFTAEMGSADEVEEHPDVPALLRSLKRIGAQNASSRRPAGLAARQTTLRMMAIYAERFGHSGRIPATYEILSGLARKG